MLWRRGVEQAWAAQRRPEGGTPELGGTQIDGEMPFSISEGPHREPLNQRPVQCLVGNTEA